MNTTLLENLLIKEKTNKNHTKAYILESSTRKDSAHNIFEIDLLEKTDALTYGNLLRRILIDKIPGFGITHIYIEGVVHELDNVQGVQEDTIEILSRFSTLHISYNIYSEEPLKIELPIIGPCIVDGKYIKDNSILDICNEEVILFHVNMNISFKIGLIIKSGKGFKPSDEQEILDSFIITTSSSTQNTQKNVDTQKITKWMGVDTIFSPVLHVNFISEQSREGENISLEKVKMEITTKKSVDPTNVLIYGVEWAVFCLKQILSSLTEISINKDNTESSTICTTEETRNPLYSVHVKSVDSKLLSTRCKNILLEANITTIGDIFKLHQDKKLDEIPKLGRGSKLQIQKLLEDINETNDMIITEDYNH